MSDIRIEKASEVSLGYFLVRVKWQFLVAVLKQNDFELRSVSYVFADAVITRSRSLNAKKIWQIQPGATAHSSHRRACLSLIALFG